MTIQMNLAKKMVRVGNKFFPAKPFRPETGNNDPLFPYGQGYLIPLGETGKELSIAIGYGTYSDNYNNMEFDFEAEMEEVEVGFEFPHMFDVTSTNDDGLLEMIEKGMNGENPF